MSLTPSTPVQRMRVSLANPRIVLVAMLLLANCGDEPAPRPAAASPSSAAASSQGRDETSEKAPQTSILHLADHFQDAEGTAEAAPDRRSLHWSFAEPRPEWLAGASGADPANAVLLEPLPDALRIKTRTDGESFGRSAIGIFTALDSTSTGDWSALVVRARTHDRLAGIGVGVNVGEADNIPDTMQLFMGGEHSAPVFSDGSAQEYHLELPALAEGEALESVGVFFGAMGPGSLEVLDITLLPRGGDFPESVGARAVTRGGETRRTLFAHAPARLSWPVTVQARSRLDLALTGLPGESLHYTVAVKPAGPAASVVLLDETIHGASDWQQRSVDLHDFVGKPVELTLAAEGEGGGEVALWGAPVLSWQPAEKSQGLGPNVVFYVIDGGGADEMSLYHYGRPTTPFLEELAEEGVVFERAFSNATWTQPSTVSFMTSLQHSVLGGLRRGVHSTPVPDAATTFSEHMRRGGWQTASFSANPNAGRVIGLERGMDVQQDHEPGAHSTSSSDLAARFWHWRETYPGNPYWVHFQTTDVHEPNEPVAPFAGRFVSEERREQLDEWEGRMWQAGGDLFGKTSIAAFYDEALARAGIDRKAFFEGRRGLYDETFGYQDLQLRRLVETLKERGEWENTLLVIGADHGHPAGTFSRWGRALFDPQPPPWEGALFDSFSTRVPLVFVWPGKLPGGKRLSTPVSMIDVLPTVLDLCGLPAPEVCQGRSLAPLMRGESDQHPPVILDEFRIDERTGEPIGNLDIVDGRWGASLQIGPSPSGETTSRGRYAVPSGGRWGAVHPFFPDVPQLLLYDLDKDPFALHAVNDEHPEEVQHYEELLRELWAAHQALGTQYREASGAALTPEQLKTLQTLGYIR